MLDQAPQGRQGGALALVGGFAVGTERTTVEWNCWVTKHERQPCVPARWVEDRSIVRTLVRSPRHRARFGWGERHAPVEHNDGCSVFPPRRDHYGRLGGLHHTRGDGELASAVGGCPSAAGCGERRVASWSEQADRLEEAAHRPARGAHSDAAHSPESRMRAVRCLGTTFPRPGFVFFAPRIHGKKSPPTRLRQPARRTAVAAAEAR